MDPEEWVPCPFTNTHMVRYKRFPYHIQDCKKNYPNHNMVQCPFNARHWIAKPELRHHISICTHKRTIEAELEYENNHKSEFFGGNVSVPPYTTEYGNSAESWDDDTDHPTFVLGQTQPPNRNHHINTNNNRNNCAVEVETVFVPSARTAHANVPLREEKPTVETEVRMPKNVPQVLQSQHKHNNTVQATQPLGRGYGRGYAVPSTQPSVAPGRGRGRGLLDMHTNNAGQFRSLSDVLKMSPTEQSKVASSRSSPVNTTQVNGVRQMNSDSPYSTDSESSSPSISNRFPPQSASLGAQPRGVNAPASLIGRGRAVPSRASLTPSPTPSSESGSSSQTSSFIGRGRSMTNGAGQKMVGVGRGYRPITNRGSVPAVSGIRPLHSGESNSPSSASDSDQFESDVEKDKLRHERKLRKKLKQIEKLELKLSQGQTLLQEEKQKLSQKTEVTRELQILKASES